MSRSALLNSIEMREMEWRDIYESRQTKKLLKGTASAVEDIGGVACIVVFYGDIRVLIPISKLGDLIAQQENDAIRRRMGFSYVGSELEFVVDPNGIDKENNIVFADRQAALRVKRSLVKKLTEGDRIRVNVVAVGKKVIIAEANGVENKLSAASILWGYAADLRDHISNGDSFDAIIKTLDRENETFTFSIKEAQPDPYETALKKYKAGGEYMGTVSYIPDGSIFVNIDNGIDVLCPHPGWANIKLDVGDKVLVKLRIIEPEKRKMRGLITRLIKKNKYSI